MSASRRVTAPFGSWESPISPADVAVRGRSLSEVTVAGDLTYWLELRPAEGGRTVLMRGDVWSEPIDVTPEGFDVRTRVHEYGGGAYTLHERTAFFTNDADQGLYRLEEGIEPRRITPEPPEPHSVRHADGRVTPDGSTLVCVRERHEPGGDVVNELVSLPADGSAEPHPIASGRDFYASPRVSPDGRRLAWLEWDLPAMPWDGTELLVAELGADGSLGEVRRVAGGPGESIFQPSWSPSGVLHFVSDRTGWWNLYRERDGRVEALRPMEAEFGVPQWALGYSTYAFLDDERIACTYGVEGVGHLALLDPDADQLLDMDVPYGVFDPPSVSAESSRIAFVAGGPTLPHRVVSLDFAARSVDELRESRSLPVGEDHLSVPRAIEFPAGDGESARAWFYAPHNPGFEGPEGERPPLIVLSHGGPTGEASPEFDVRKQFWASRGFAVVDVNYGGSTGYGRAYRERLDGMWGITDVRDCIAAARFLVEHGEVDGERLIVRGGSAGGYTTLCALTFHDDFSAGASYYGVAELEIFARTTHKFESRYLERLIGPYPERADLYRARSPINFTDLLSAPVIVFQGLEDRVVPPEQAELMVAALEAKGLPYAYVAFGDEQHGFRKAENIRRALEAELAFYARVFGFEPADDLPPLDVRNL